MADAISRSSLSAEDKRLFDAVIRASHSNKELLRLLMGRYSLKRVVWFTSFRCDDGTGGELFLLDDFVKPTASAGVPLVCVVLDSQGSVRSWSKVAIFSRGFVRASIARDNGRVILSVTTIANWFRGIGVYKYNICGNQVQQISESFLDASSVRIREYNKDPPELYKMLEEARAADTI